MPLANRESGNSDRYSKIKDVYLRLYDYQFDHGPREGNEIEENPHFVGREQLKTRIRLLLDPDHNKSKHGAYLVTGYRGMGKTSLVRESLSKFRKEGSIETFEFFLSQDDVRDIDLLRQIGWNLNDYIKAKVLRSSNFSAFIIRFLSFLFFLSSLLVVLDLMVPGLAGSEYTLKSMLGKLGASYEVWYNVIVVRPLIFIFIGLSLQFLYSKWSNYRKSKEEKAEEEKNKSVDGQSLRMQLAKQWGSWIFFLLAVIITTIAIAKYKIGFLIDFENVFPFDDEKKFNFEEICFANISLSLVAGGIFWLLFNLIFPWFETFYRRGKFEEIRSKKNRYRNSLLMVAKFIFVSGFILQAIHLAPFIFQYLEYNLLELFSGQLGIGRPLLFFAFVTFIISAGQMLVQRILYLFPSFKIKKDLEDLLHEFQSRLYANVSQEKNGEGLINLGSNNPLSVVTGKLLGFFQSSEGQEKNTLNYQVATTKEIEQFLFRILNKIHDLRGQYEISSSIWNSYKSFPIPKFVFIVDELDKVEPNYYFSPGDRESDAFMHHNDSPIHVSTKARRRQEAIAKLLANLKGFLNNADAKFIFIGGRGMYDAALADISDRETFYSSIFNEVIYVPSFFKDSITPQAGLSEMTEYFVSQYLLENFDRKNLKPFRTYLKLLSNLSLKEKFKITHLLQNFFIFCVYRSNGSPKKLIEIFEKFVIELDSEKYEEIVNQKNGLIFPNEEDATKKSRLYLKFSFQDQYEINLTSNLYRPYLIIHSRHLKQLGDKLLYSSAFLMDHILKFHRTAFSFRNLELIPDIILANKDPNLRRFFQDIMSFLSKMHIRETVNAIFQYKFYSRVENELMFVSKISEFSSAAFNFTLDESYHLKSYYKKKLAAKYKEFAKSDFEKNYIHSVGYLHTLIGDLHYYDEEYDDAIIHYTDAIQPFRSVLAEKGKLQPNQFVLFTRNSLHLGLCLEKLQSFDKAYSVYRNLVLQSRLFNAVLDMDADSAWEIPFNRMQLFLRPSIALLNVIEKARPDGITYDNLVRNMQEYLLFLKLDDVRLFPMKGGIQTPDYESFDHEYFTPTKNVGWRRELSRSKRSKDKKRIFSLLTDYYINVGSLLYFKNKLFFRLVYRNQFKFEKTEEEIKKHLSAKMEKREYFPAISSYVYYMQALKFFMVPYVENFMEFNGLQNPFDLNTIKDRSRLIAFFLRDKQYAVLNATEQIIIANILGKLGDSLFASIKNNVKSVKADFLKKAGEDQNLNVISLFKLSTINPLSIERVIAIYLLAHNFYKKAGRVQSASLQLKKILYLAREIKVDLGRKFANEEEFYEDRFGNFINKMANNILKGLINITEVSNRAQIKKMRSIGLPGFDIRTSGSRTSMIYNGNSTAPEVKEVLLIIETIKRNYINDYNEPRIQIGPYSTVSDMFIRVLELKYQGEVEFKKLLDIIGWTTFPAKGIGELKKDLIHRWKIYYDKNLTGDLKVHFEHIRSEIEHSVINGFFCLYESIRILNTYGVDYILNYSFLAANHYRLAKFCIMFEVLKDMPNIQVESELKKLIGGSFLRNSGPYYHFDKSIYYNRKAVQMHNEGAGYKVTNRSMYTLDDDFNDDFVHFCAAIERYRINVGQIRLAKSKAEDYLSDSLLHNYENYLEYIKMSPSPIGATLKIETNEEIGRVVIKDNAGEIKISEDIASNNCLIDTAALIPGDYMVTLLQIDEKKPSGDEIEEIYMERWVEKI